MLRKVLAHWLKRPWTFMFMVSGYVISILIISMSIGKIDSIIINMECNQFGRIGERSAVEIYSQSNNAFKYNPKEIIQYLGTSGEIDLLNTGKVDVSKGSSTKRVEIIPAYFDKKANWQPPLYKGEYITPEECKNGEKKVLIGTEVAEGVGINVNDVVSIMNEKYKVKGIIGQEYDWNNYNEIVYVPIKALSDEYIDSKIISKKDNIMDATLLYRVNDEKITEISKSLESKFDKNKFNIDRKKIYDTSIEYSHYLNETLKSKIPLILVSLINISTMSVFWVMSRRKELTVKKVMGAHDKYIKNSIRKDMLILALFSVLISIVLQEILFILVESKINKFDCTFKLNWVNASVSIIIAIIVGYISSIFPMNKTMEIIPADGIKVE
ncbi:FtsX-like permease family protein [Inconstantimicrobium mannanitabidum]|uniref:Uncharacterized protein n=1 Tax=Inconstantimicrobium mannanitabidum TaxID=1604901 RepID=A0ACB5RE41_9CLOT|nr:ABC transporter permease [Clostridium sp. TW13]GKX67021.1 hypothetical protein rsdtw13_22790 [Clostridium sp. TW13]